MIESLSRGAFHFGELLPVLRTVGPLLTLAIGAWLRGKYGRKVKVKSREIAVEASSVEEVEKLLELARRHYKTISHR
jgi:hypothetical protein